MAFKPIQYDSGKMVRLPVAATTFTKGDACKENGSGYYEKAQAADGQQVTHVIMETVASAATEGDMKLFIRVPGVVFEADCDAVASRTDVGTSVDLASAGTVNVDATGGDYVFYVEDLVGVAETTTVVRGWFNTSDPMT